MYECTKRCCIREMTLMRLVLLEAPFDPSRRQRNSVLLTVDLTKAVAEEAIDRNDSIIVSYRRSCLSLTGYTALMLLEAQIP